MNSKRLIGLLFLIFVVATAVFARDEGNYDENIANAGLDDEEVAEYVDSGDESDGEETDTEEMDGDLLDEELEAHSSVIVSPYFLDFSDFEFPLNEDIELLISFVNNDEGSFNFTELSYENPVTVEGESLSTLCFKFLPDPALDTRDFDLVLTVFYEDVNDNLYASTFFNDTISIVESLDKMDLRVFFVYCAAIAAVLLAIFFTYRIYTSVKEKKTSDVVKGDDWIPDYLKDRKRSGKGGQPVKGKKKVA